MSDRQKPTENDEKEKRIFQINSYQQTAKQFYYFRFGIPTSA